MLILKIIISITLLVLLVSTYFGFGKYKYLMDVVSVISCILLMIEGVIIGSIYLLS